MMDDSVGDAKKRCSQVIEKVERLSGITASCKRTLVKLARSELTFLSHRRSTAAATPLSTNIGHVEAVVDILQQPFITGVSRVCKPIPLSTSSLKKNEKHVVVVVPLVHVDIVCTLNTKPVWIIVSDRNPKYITWKGKGASLQSRIQQLTSAARSAVEALRPSSLILFFANGLSSSIVSHSLKHEFGATQIQLDFSVFNFDFMDQEAGDWINVLVGRTYQQACAFEIKLISDARDAVFSSESNVKDSWLVPSKSTNFLEDHKEFYPAFSSFVSKLHSCSLEATQLRNLLGGFDLINFDTTALIALVSGISNGGTQKLLATPESELRQRFKGNYDFVIGQVMSELQNPILVELDRTISGRPGIICESVHSEFKELVLMCGGPNEKSRADHLLKCLIFVPDNPSKRMMTLPTTRKLALKNKIVFGTGDYWCAPTVTANMAFVRAISQAGMSLSTIQHRPRALTGD